MKYKSKIGFGIASFIIVVVGGTSILMIVYGIWFGLAINIALIGFIVYFFSSTYYKINGNVLTIKSGFMISKTININTIKRIEETNNPLSSPANSLDRIRICFNKNDEIMISPVRKMDFINQIIAINPSVEVELKKKDKSKSTANQNHSMDNKMHPNQPSD